MLTVIIAEQHIIEQYEQNKALLAPFDKGETVFCRLNCEGGSIDEMLPDLNDIVSFNTNWRAVIVTDNNKNAINPFDCVHYSEFVGKDEPLEFDSHFTKKCLKMIECCEATANNTLTKLSVALCETPYFAEVIDVDLSKLLESDETFLRFIFKVQLESENTKKLTFELRKYRYEKLSSFVEDEDVEDFLTAVADKNYGEIFRMLAPEKLMQFLQFARIGSPAMYDPGYWYTLVENTRKSQIYGKLKRHHKLKIELPTEVLCLALRDCDTRVHNSKVIWSNNSETDYTDFVRYNMYSDDMRFLIYDTSENSEKNKPAELLKFHMLLQIIAMHGNSSFSLTKNRFFIVDLEYDKADFSHTIATLIARLKATAIHINEEIIVLKSKKIPVLDNNSARKLFEKDVTVPVQLDREYDSSNLKAQHRIGLFSDSPTNEYPYWDEQYRGITKLFKRFLREPRRAVKKACLTDFRENNAIPDKRAISLNENQKEDILIKLQEEEQSMVATKTSSIYNADKYNKSMEQADKEIRRGIEQRMTRKKGILVLLLAVIAYFIGFCPMIFSNLNNMKSFSFSWILTGAVVALFALCGVVFLIVMKRRQVKRYKNFNSVMGGICSEIDSSLEDFSTYLSHACMVMREQSVLEMAEVKVTDDISTIRILKYNLSRIEKFIENNYKLLTAFSDETEEALLSPAEKLQIKPFANDYTSQDEFTYPLYSGMEGKEIEYMLKGCKVEVPVSCVNRVTLVREELYD